APVVVKRLAVEVVDARALDIGCARGLGGLAAVRVPTLLPVGQRGLGLAQGVLAGFVALAEGVQRGLGLGDRLLQDRQSFLVTADVLSQLGDRILGLFAGAQQALRQLALVGDLLLDTRQRAAHFVAGSLGAVERLHRVLALHTAFFKRALGLALLGDQLLQAGLFLRQPFAQHAQLRVQRAVFQRLPFSVADPAFGLDRGVLFCLPRLPRQVAQLLADLLAQVVETIEVFARVADSGLGFLAPLLVLGDAGGLLQVHAQVLGPCLDDLADHPLFDDRIAAWPQARAQEQVGDVAPAALGAVEVVVALAIARDQALDRDLVEGREDRKSVV